MPAFSTSWREDHVRHVVDWAEGKGFADCWVRAERFVQKPALEARIVGRGWVVCQGCDVE